MRRTGETREQARQAAVKKNLCGSNDATKLPEASQECGHVQLHDHRTPRKQGFQNDASNIWVAGFHTSWSPHLVFTDRLRPPATPLGGLRVSGGPLHSKMRRLAQLLTPAHSHTGKDRQPQLQTHVCTCTHTHTNKHVLVHTRTRTRTHTHSRTCTRAHACTASSNISAL